MRSERRQSLRPADAPVGLDPAQVSLNEQKLASQTALPYEIANVLARLVFDGALQVSEVSEIWDDLAALRLVLHPFDLTEDGHEIAAITAQLGRRHATESTYVHLARRLGTVLWTLDTALARNADDLGLAVQLLS